MVAVVEKVEALGKAAVVKVEEKKAIVEVVNLIRRTKCIN